MHSGVKRGDIQTTYTNCTAHWFIVMAYSIKKQIMMDKISDVNDSMCWQVGELPKYNGG